VCPVLSLASDSLKTEFYSVGTIISFSIQSVLLAPEFMPGPIEIKPKYPVICILVLIRICLVTIVVQCGCATHGDVLPPLPLPAFHMPKFSNSPPPIEPYSYEHCPATLNHFMLPSTPPYQRTISSACLTRSCHKSSKVDRTARKVLSSLATHRTCVICSLVVA
jgi:hypothetical protein